MLCKTNLFLADFQYFSTYKLPEDSNIFFTNAFNSIDTLMNAEAPAGFAPNAFWEPVYPANIQLLGTSFQKGPTGLFGAKPAGASAFISVSMLIDTDALAGFAMPARASAFNSV